VEASFVVTLAAFVVENHQTVVVMLGWYAARTPVVRKASHVARTVVVRAAQSAVQELVSYCYPSLLSDKSVDELYRKVALMAMSAPGVESANL
jgi:hypothetical protein